MELERQCCPKPFKNLNQFGLDTLLERLPEDYVRVYSFTMLQVATNTGLMVQNFLSSNT